MLKEFAAIVMAAGKSTRMKSDIPKAAHRICGKPITGHVIDACRSAGIEQVVVVVGFQAGLVKAALGDGVDYALQTEQLGTGHACAQAMPLLEPHVRRVMVLPGDAPLLESALLLSLAQIHGGSMSAATALTAMLADPAQYGRVVRDDSGDVRGIVEAKDADAATLAIREINTSVYCFERDDLEEMLKLVKPDNAQGEYYLTEVVALLVAAGKRVGTAPASDFRDVLGINNRTEMAQAARIMRMRILCQHMLEGVTIVDPDTTYIDSGVTIGRDTVVYPCTLIEGESHIGGCCQIGPFANLRSVNIADGMTVGN